MSSQILCNLTPQPPLHTAPAPTPLNHHLNPPMQPNRSPPPRHIHQSPPNPTPLINPHRRLLHPHPRCFFRRRKPRHAHSDLARADCFSDGELPVIHDASDVEVAGDMARGEEVDGAGAVGVGGSEVEEFEGGAGCLGGEEVGCVGDLEGG